MLQSDHQTRKAHADARDQVPEDEPHCERGNDPEPERDERPLRERLPRASMQRGRRTFYFRRLHWS
jgi:hypothetical protein